MTVTILVYISAALQLLLLIDFIVYICIHNIHEISLIYVLYQPKHSTSIYRYNDKDYVFVF